MFLDLPSRYPEYLITTILIILAPGPSVLFTIARAISWGRAAAVATVAGNVTGAFVVSLIVAFGLGPILQRSAITFTTVQILGGLYLIYLGIDAIRHSAIHASEMINVVKDRPSPLKSMRDGFWVGALNPKVLVFFAAILPQFVDKDGAAPITQQLIAMGATFSILAFIGDSTWGLLAGTLRNQIARSPKKLVLMRRVGGIVMIGLGLFTLSTAL